MFDAPQFEEKPDEARSVWAQALRSGQYPRCRVFLTLLTPDREYRFSCFGVACDLFRRRYPQWLRTFAMPLAAADFACLEYGDQSNLRDRFYLPDVVRRWLGLVDAAASLHDDYAHLGRDTLCELEDDGYSFTELADLIDAGAVQTVVETEA